MISSGLALSDSFVFQTGKGRQYIDWRCHTFSVQLPAQNNLSFCNISGQVRDWMGLVILRHGQDRDHRDTSLFAVLTPGTLIHRGKVCVHISRISASSRHFFSCRRHFTQRIRIVGDICQDDQNMHIFFKCQIFRSRQRHFRRCDSLNGRVICQVYKQNRSVNGSGLLKALHKEVGLFESNSHRSKYNRKFFIRSQYFCLSCNLGSQFCMGQSGC